MFASEGKTAIRCPIAKLNKRMLSTVSETRSLRERPRAVSSPGGQTSAFHLGGIASGLLSSSSKTGVPTETRQPTDFQNCCGDEDLVLAKGICER